MWRCRTVWAGGEEEEFEEYYRDDSQGVGGGKVQCSPENIEHVRKAENIEDRLEGVQKKYQSQSSYPTQD